MPRKINNRDITICFISHSSGIAGAEKVFPKLLDGLQRKGVKVKVLLPEFGPVLNELNKKNISYSIIPYCRWLNSDSETFKRIKRTIRNIVMVIPVIFKLFQWKCDIVYTNTSTICSGAFAAKLMRIPHIWHFREFGFEDYGYKFDLGNKLSFYLINRLSTICLANSKAVAEKYKQYLPSNKIMVIYESYSQINDNLKQIIIEDTDFKCVLIGTLLKTKGHEDAISAVAELHKNGIKASLHIIGSGDETYKLSLIKLIKKLKIENYIKFLGYLENPQSILKQFDVLFLCSINEAFGLVTLEAMQEGVPVIGTRRGGTIELVEEGVTGFLYEPGNFIELSEKVKFLYKNPILKEKMGLNATLRAKTNFPPLQYIENTLKLLEDVVNKES